MASNLQSDLDELKQFFIDLLKDNPDGILKHTIWWELQEKSGHAILPQQYNIGLTKDAKKTVFSLWNDDIEEINSKDGPILRLRKRAKSEPLTAGELADANLVHEEARIMAANKEDEHRLLRDTIAVDGDSTSVTTTTQLPEAMDGSGAARTGVQGSKQTPEDKMQPLLTIPPPIMPIRGRLFALPNQKPMAPNPTSNMFVQLHPLLGCALNIPRFNQPMPLLNLQQPPTGQVTANQYGQRMHYPRYITMPQTFNQARQSATFLQQPPPNRLPQDIMKQSLNLPKTSQANLTYNTAIGMTNVGITTHQAPSRKECQDADKQTASAPVRDRKSSTENVNSTSAATMVEKKEFVNEDIYVKPVFIPKGQAPSNTVVEGIAKECIELLADHNEFVTSDRVKELLLRRFGVASVRNLGYNTIDHVPCVFELNRMVCKINEYIMAFIKTRSMFTLYEFRECLREFVPNKEDFSQLKLGPLQRFPEIYRHFKFPPDQEEIPEITSMELLDHLDRYLTLNNRWTSRLEIEDFMNYLVAEYSADNAYYLGVKIKSLPLALQVLKKAKRDAGARRREILEHFYTSLRSDIEDAFRRFRTSVLQSGDDGMEVRRHYLKIKADDAIMEIFEKFKLLQMIEQPTTHAEQRALLKFTNAFGEFMKLVQQNKTCKMLFHLAICISSTSLQECAMDFLTSPSTSQPAPVEETPTQPRPNKANLVRAFREYVDGCLAAGSQLNLQNLRKIEEKLAEGFKFPSFHDMGYGSFLHFLLREGKQVLEESGGDLIGAHMAGSTSDTAFKPHQDDIVKFIRQGRECGVTQPLQLEEALCSQYGVKDFRQLGHGHFGHLLKLASPTQLSPEFTVVYETTLVARSGVSLVKTDKVGILGDQTLHNAKVCLHNCPLLTDLADWSQWGPVFEPQHGKLKGFIQRYGGVTTHMEDGKIVTFDIVAMETKPGHLIKITGNTSAEQFTAALVVGDVTGVCGHLVSLTVSSKGVADLPAALLSSHMTTTLHQMHAVDEEFTPGAPQILGGTHSQAVQFVLSCLVKMPIRTCIALTNQIFLEPLGKVVGCTRSKQELLRACSSVTERTRLLELGYTLGVSEWTGSLDARCELPESAVETIPLSEMEDFFDMEDEEKAESVISYESQEELESSFSDVESVELVDEDGKPTESSTAESLVDECLDTVSAAASGDAEAKIDDGTILDVAPVGTDTDTSTGDEVNSCLNIVNQIRREEFGIGVDLNEDGQKLMKVCC